MNPLIYSIPLVALIFDAYCLLDLSGAEQVRLLPPMYWFLVIAFCTPFGGIAYLALGRVR